MALRGHVPYCHLALTVLSSSSPGTFRLSDQSLIKPARQYRQSLGLNFKKLSSLTCKCFNLKRSTCRPNLQQSETPLQSHSMPSKSLVKRLRAIYEVVVTLYEVTLYEVVEKMLKRLKNPFNGKAISRRDGLFCKAADSRDFLG